MINLIIGENMKQYDFVAVDFENADNDQHACQVGIVTVINGVIHEEIEHLIKPPGNRYGKIQIGVHGITPNVTANSKTLDQIWPEIEPYFKDQTVLFHSGDTDNAILSKSLKFYWIDIPKYNVLDTKLIIANKRLEVLAEAYGIELSNHHNALADAKATAEIYLKHLSGFIPETWPEENKTTNILYKNKKIDKTLLIPDLNCGNKNNPFFDRKIVITGEFSIPRNDIAKMINELGADINTAISKKTNFVIVGTNPGESKMKSLGELKLHGYDIRVIYEKELAGILNGTEDTVFVEKEVKKKLKLTYDRLIKNSFSAMNVERTDLFSSKEFYICGSFGGHKNLLNQMVGFLGALTNEELDPTIDIILLGDETIANLRNGITDDVIELIEKKYNESKSISFKFVFLSEFEFISYYKYRVEGRYKEDDIICSVFERYFQTYSNYCIEQQNRLKFDDDKNYYKDGNKYYFRLENGKTWCPSRQIRD
jgi:DNA polymerase-3 subunit epsilon